VIPSPQTTKPIVLPAPVGGINALANLMAMPPEDCIYAYNYIPQTNGMQVRRGYQNVGYGFSGSAPYGVRTLIAYKGSTAAKDRLFACTLEGIYNITTPAISYSIGGGDDIAWASKTGNAGHCTYTIYTTIADKFILLCDEVNGLYRYSEASDTWVRVVQGAGVLEITDTAGAAGSTSPNDFRFVTVWKQRVWFVLKDSGTAFYLPVGQIAGTIVPLYFGNKFLKGGFLHSIHNYTLDGGNGPDDFLVALSSAGDVVAYQGTDPSAVATFSTVGVWNIGDLPVGRNITASTGGDLYILCSYGLVSLTQILKGVEPGALPAYITGKITPLVRKDIATKRNSYGWNVTQYSADGLLFITVPGNTATYEPFTQYVMNITTRAWSVLVDVPMDSIVEWNSVLYFGGKAGTGTVYKYTGTQDNVAYGAATGEPIDAFLLSAFQGSGANTRVHFIKPQFIGRGLPLFKIDARYDFDLDNTVIPLSGTFATGLALWGSPTTWGTAIWGDAPQRPFSELRGASGLGKFAGLALTTRSIEDTTLIGFTAMADQGGLL
jgi:hypothetical protein